MPVYRYECQQCEVFVDVTRSIEELDTLPECDMCGSKLKRIYAIGGVEFKGEGWGKD